MDNVEREFNIFFLLVQVLYMLTILTYLIDRWYKLFVGLILSCMSCIFVIFIKTHQEIKI